VRPLRRAAAAALLGLATGAAAASPQEHPAHAHIAHVADAFDATPTGSGLLALAMGEAEVVALHVELAGMALGDLASMKLHMTHVLHALDPTLVLTGPGRGYGLRAAAIEVARHIDMAGSTEGASDNVRFHAVHVATTARNAAERADQILGLAQQILETNSATAAAGYLERLTAVSDILVEGTDANRDGRIGYERGEGGLRQTTQHLTLMRRGEGMLQ